MATVIAVVQVQDSSIHTDIISLLVLVLSVPLPGNRVLPLRLLYYRSTCYWYGNLQLNPTKSKAQQMLLVTQLVRKLLRHLNQAAIPTEAK